MTKATHAALVESLINQALDHGFVKHDSWHFECAELLPDVTKKFKLRQLEVWTSHSLPDFVIGWKDYRDSDLELASHITHVWRLAASNDPGSPNLPDSATTYDVIQRVAKYFPKAMFAGIVLRLSNLVSASAGRQIKVYDFDAIKQWLLNRNWTDVNSILDLKYREPLRNDPTAIDSLIEYSWMLVKNGRESYPIALLSAASIVWFDAALTAVARGDNENISRYFGLASEAASAALFHYGYRGGLLPENRSDGATGFSEAARVLAERSAARRRQTTDLLLQDFHSLKLSKNKAKTVLAKKYNLAESTVRDKLKGA